MDYLAITKDPTGKPVDRQRTYTQTILDVKSVPTTATSYATQWKGYDLLIVCAMFYGNIEASIIVPGAYFDGTTSGQRIQLTDPISTRLYEVYKDGDSAIFVKCSTRADAKYGVCIYGVIVH